MIRREEHSDGWKGGENILGETRSNNFGTKMEIVKYRNRNDIRIKFLDKYGYEMNTTYDNFKIGKIKNQYDPSVFGVGYVGEGKYLTQINHITTKEYQVWNNLLARCYSKKQRKLHPAYENCTVCDEWLNFQVFSEWYNENYYPIENERIHIDKDILIKGNKIYSPETCLLVPQRINMIFMSRGKTRDKDLPNAIYRCTKGYRASYGGKSLGIFKTSDDAIYAHDNAMKINILRVVENYKDKIPLKVYDALCRY